MATVNVRGKRFRTIQTESVVLPSGASEVEFVMNDVSVTFSFSDRASNWEPKVEEMPATDRGLRFLLTNFIRAAGGVVQFRVGELDGKELICAGTVQPVDPALSSNNMQPARLFTVTFLVGVD